MSVWIQRIVVQNLGPLGNLSLDLGGLNLIYGRNETGKTFLVEFVLRALFRGASEWPLRGELGRGKVTVSGLADKPVEFSPDGRKKLEDYWEQQAAGLPTNMGRLLVVKGAELALTETGRDGVDRDMLKTALSSQRLIDRIRLSIQPTVLEAQVVDGRIEGARRGEIKAREGLRQDLERLDRLAEQVETRYSRSRLRALELQRDELGAALAQQREAKRHEAYRLQQEREQIRAKRSHLPKDRLEALSQDLGRRQDKQAELERLRERHSAVESQVEHYPWLSEAVALWERRDLEAAPARTGSSAIAAATLLLLGILAALAGLALDLSPTLKLALGLAAFAASGLGLILGFGAFRRARSQAVAALDVEERRGIEIEFERRFGRAPGALPGLKAQEAELRDRQARFERLEEDIQETEAEIQSLSDGIGRTLRELTGDAFEPEAWAQAAEGLRMQERALAEQGHRLELRLSELAVDESDRRPEPAEVEYSADRLRALEGELGRVEAELRSAQRDLENLKQELTRETGDEISASWEVILDHLRQRRGQAAAEYRQTTARLLGQIGVAQVLEKIRAEEDIKIRSALAAPEVSGLLRAFTGQYHTLDFVNGALMARGELAERPLADLSTGAREQVLLALRMGFASRLAAGQPLFMLLDDAFQHSDWERRERLVAQALRMVQAGWQVTYLTMDDHLRDLFDAAAREALDGEYRLHVIDA